MFKWGSKAGPPASGNAPASGQLQNDKRDWHQQIAGEKYFGMENVSTPPAWSLLAVAVAGVNADKGAMSALGRRNGVSRVKPCGQRPSGVNPKLTPI